MNRVVATRMNKAGYSRVSCLRGTRVIFHKAKTRSVRPPVSCKLGVRPLSHAITVMLVSLLMVCVVSFSATAQVTITSPDGKNTYTACPCVGFRCGPGCCCEILPCDQCVVPVAEREVNIEHTGESHQKDGGGISGIPESDIENQPWFQRIELWMVKILFEKYLLPNFFYMINQLSAIPLLQMQVVGAFLDAKHQMETQRLFQYMNAQTFRDYYPSEGLCSISTLSRSIMASDQKQNATVAALSQGSIKRQLLNANRNAAEGTISDRAGRMKQFREKYCEAKDNNGAFVKICGSSVAQLRKNRDIDYGRLLSEPMTLNIDFANAPASGAQAETHEDFFALASNLYSHEVMRQIPSAFLQDRNSIQETYMDFRSIIAKRSVAEQSFFAIAALKTPGDVSAESYAFLLELMKEMGFAEDEAKRLLSENPSYYQQLELVSRKMFQRPEFYVDLMDKPANVARKGVALQALSLLPRRELFKSALRTEAMLAILLELEIESHAAKANSGAWGMVEQ